MSPKEQKAAAAALQLALYKLGGTVAVAQMLGITGGAVSQWACVPSRHVATIASLTGLSKADLRPDIYEPKEGA